MQKTRSSRYGSKKEMDLVKDDLEFLYLDKEGAKNVENVDDVTRLYTGEFYCLWSDSKLYKCIVIDWI